MKYLTLTPKSYYGVTPITREYSILELHFSDFSDSDKKAIQSEARLLATQANSSAANSGLPRDQNAKLCDAYSGIIAEYAVVYFLNSLIPNSAYRPKVTSSINQVDINWNYNNLDISIEVRSSFVKNGISFALYAYNAKKNQMFFDIIGPYYQGDYKPDFESQKDYYFRVLFVGDKNNTIEDIIENDCPFYLIGAIKGKVIIEYNLHKKLSQGEANFKIGNPNGDYYVIPISNIVDAGTISKKTTE